MLSGYKTYIVAGFMAIMGVLKLLGVDIPGFEGDAGTPIAAALGLIFARLGAVKA